MGQSNFYTLQVLRDIGPGEEITVNYGTEYFKDGRTCLCDHCVPGHVSFQKPKGPIEFGETRTDLVLAKRKDGREDGRLKKKFRIDSQTASMSPVPPDTGPPHGKKLRWDPELDGEPLVL